MAEDARRDWYEAQWERLRRDAINRLTPEDGGGPGPVYCECGHTHAAHGGIAGRCLKTGCSCARFR